MIIVALHKETSLRPPTKLLFRCLAVSDICVGAIWQPGFTSYALLSATTVINWKFILYIMQGFELTVLGQVSVFTSSAIGVERVTFLGSLRGIQGKELARIASKRHKNTNYTHNKKR